MRDQIGKEWKIKKIIYFETEDLKYVLQDNAIGIYD